MKKILILLALTFFSCAENKNDLTSTVTVNDEKSKKVSLMMQGYVDNAFDTSILSEDASIKFR